ncbi:MAG: cyclic nucleotide-binding domain-containing protein [Bdellovibrionales bacterium]|nr:cyclic nucleotide-binding domain-containing protein [Bdellovibrionales bacterium]
MSGVIKFRKGDILFREGDSPDAMYVIKSGLIEITKAKGSKDIVLATLKPGEMLGEMAFFDDKPRSAGARASIDAEVIKLPFSALHAQFKTFPEWLKAMVKTVNSNLRAANQRIKNLETAQSGDEMMFPPHMITRLSAVISLIGFKAGEKEGDALIIPYNLLRNYTIQIFQLPTNKMDKIMEIFSGLGYMKVEDLGEGKKKVSILNHALISQFTDWYNKYLFTEEAKRVTIEPKEMKAMKALIFYGKKQTPNDKGEVKINLTEMQNSSMKDFGHLVGVNDADSLAEKGLIQEKQSGEGGVLTSNFKMEDLEIIYPFWEIVHILTQIPGRG